MDDGHPGVPGDPLSVGGQDLRPDLLLGLLLPHERQVPLILDHAGHQCVIPHNLTTKIFLENEFLLKNAFEHFSLRVTRLDL